MTTVEIPGARFAETNLAGESEAVSIVTLGDPRAAEPDLAGAKASSLARAAAAGLPVLPGFVVTTAATSAAAFPSSLPRHLEAELRAAWCKVSCNGSRAVVVRSSSTIEDGRSTSMAGLFTSQLDVRGWDHFLDAVAAVLASAKSVSGIEAAPMAVLVQPMLTPHLGGVLFGADPVSGRRDRYVAAAVDGGPDRLVSGEVDGARYTLSRRGRTVTAERPLEGLTRGHRRALARLARQTAAVLDGPQDVEWAIDDGTRLHLLQSRPITAIGTAASVSGPVLGPGPAAETFPDALTTLEEDLWVPPMRDAVVNALRLTGTATRRALSRSPVLTTVGGRVAVDLELFGIAPRRRSWLRRLDPRPPARRLIAAWRVGRLRAALPSLAGDAIESADARLLEVPALSELSDAQLVAGLRGTQPLLRALHGHEILAGLLADHQEAGVTAASVALWALAEGRASGASDAEIAARDPVVLALTASRVGAEPVLPPSPPGHRPAPPRAGGDAAPREALRLRARWAQELGARTAWELGRRLASRGALSDVDAVRHLTIDELADVARGADTPHAPLAERGDRPAAAPLAAAFRLTPDGDVVPVTQPSGDAGGGVGAGGGRAVGTVTTGDGPHRAGSVLVVRTLDPGLAPLLPQAGALVAETGSVLSHLAILARELGVPTVVGVAGATTRLRPGTRVVVDGTTGEVSPVLEGTDDRTERGKNGGLDP